MRVYSDPLFLWQTHVARARTQLRQVCWPKWKLSFSDRDPYALRYALLVLLFVSAIFSWGALGGRFIAAINPALGKQLHILNPTLDAWITPPEYTGMSPIMIATPAGARHDGDAINVPEGSVLSAHLAEKDGGTPVLLANDHKTEF